MGPSRPPQSPSATDAPAALGRSLRPRLAAPTAVARLLSDQDGVRAFRRIVEEVFPNGWREIWDARDEQGDRECARTWAFCTRVGAELFPVHEGEEYGQVAYEVPLVRFGWSFDRYHDLDCPEGEQLLLALCAPTTSGGR